MSSVVHLDEFRRLQVYWFLHKQHSKVTEAKLEKENNYVLFYLSIYVFMYSYICQNLDAQ